MTRRSRSARSRAPARSAFCIPPSITMVVYAVQANVSIIQVFPRRLPAGPAGDAAVFGLHRRLVDPQSASHAAGRSADAVSQETAASPLNLIPVLLLIIFVFLSLLMGWATATRMRGLGGARFASDCVVAGLADMGVVLGERDGRDARQLHDPADPCRGVLHGHVDGLYRHSAGARGLGRQPAA